MEQYTEGDPLLQHRIRKKVILADTLAGYADNGFAAATYFVDSWVAILSYTLQIYYDFSGYTDMAIGIALLFNIHLPQNFNEPYRAISIRDFWRRWHITLSHFLRDYIYIPLGGNRKGFWISIRNVIITFLIGGFWHGAGWLFILWGLLHGVGQAVEKCWGRWGFSLPKWLSWLLTFIFVNITWVFFRAEHISQAFRLLKGMSGLNGVSLQSIESLKWAIILILILMTIILWNPLHLLNKRNFQYSWKTAFVMAFIIMFSLLFFNRITTFLYFNF